LLLLAPSPVSEQKSIPKDVILVLDRSGSMEGEKFHQAQEALRFILTHLNPEDRFNAIAFSTGLEIYAAGLRPTSEVNEALAWVDRLSAVGSTDINRALLDAVSIVDTERPTYLIFLTDGLPTEGVIESQDILDNLSEMAPSNLRLFAFGVGYDVDTFLLDSLSGEHHGTSTYVLPGERLDESLSAFYDKISTPVLIDLELDFGELRASDIYPSPLPDLFSGSQIVVVGRYREGGVTDVSLQGEVNGEIVTFRYPHQIFASDNRGEIGPLAALPRLWATRKIGYLLNQIRLHGPDQERIDQIVRLSIRYGIVTPYTSYLVTEPLPLGEAEQERIAEEQYADMEAAPQAPVYGREAVEKAADQGALEGSNSVGIAPLEAVDVVRVVGSRAFVFADGVWVDTAFDPGQMETVKVAFLSDDYFALTKSSHELASAFALGPRVITIFDQISYEVVPSDIPTEPISLPPEPDPTAVSLPSSTPPPTPDATSESPDQPVAEPTTALPSSCLGGLIPALLFPVFGIVFTKIGARNKGK
jgi:Ca-activated chloride channel family protein